MFEGKTSAAIKLLTGHKRGGLLKLTDTADPSNPSVLVHDVLRDKHPPAQPLWQDFLVTADPESSPFHLVLFDALNGALIHSAALRTFGAPGPSGVDARVWCGFALLFISPSLNYVMLWLFLLAVYLRSLSTLTSFLSYILIALDKCPGVWPIRV